MAVNPRRGVYVRDGALLAQVDTILDDLRRRHPGRRISRESVVRELLIAAVQHRGLRRALVTGTG